MDLKEFVEQSIIQITEGVRAGQKHIEENKHGNGVMEIPKTISFDIAVVSDNSTTKDGKAALSVANLINVGGNSNKSSTNTNTNRISFNISLDINSSDNYKRNIV